MNHDFYSPMWTQYRGQFAANVATLVRAALGAVDRAFGRLAARQFSAPWRRQMRETRFSAYR
ncbi:MAG TPA: hypothetical protein VM657_09500 [Sphingomonas sp.]|nr:hypothetical protein [Sphingomonas sp.]